MICFELHDPKIGKHLKWSLNCWNLAWYHHFTHIASAKKLRGLRKKVDVLRVQTGPSSSKYEGFGRKLICYKSISFFETTFNSRVFVHSICNIQSHILKFQPFLTSFAIFHAFNKKNCAEWPWNWKTVQMNTEKVETWHV